MSEETVSRPSRPSAQTRRFRAGALIVLAVAVALGVWLALRDTGSSSETTNASLVSADQITNLAASVRHPVFWAGPKAGYTYELSQTSNGSIFIRYVPSGVEAGSEQPYLTIATYPFPGAYAAIQTVAKDTGEKLIKLANKGVAVPAENYPQSVHAAYPGVDYQVEIYDPAPGAAKDLVSSGQLAAVGDLNEGATATEAPQAEAASPADLRALAKSLGHPIYWAGQKKGFTYELLHTPSGQVYVRYLPSGVEVGSSESYLTVATYPFPGAFGAIQALGKQKGIETVELSDGGLAEIDPKYPKSIHLAYPKSDFQIEVFDPSPRQARQTVTSGQISAIG